MRPTKQSLMRPRKTRHKPRRRGVVAVKVAILSVVLIGFVALGVDVGLMYNARQELQRATTASAISAASMFVQSGTSEDGAEALGRRAAVEVAEQNAVASDPLTLTPETDVIFGQAVQPEPGSFYEFTEGQRPYNAVRVIGRRTREAPDGPIPLYFAAIFGRTTTEYTCRATALMKPRDIVVVADVSDSHNNDSELRHVNNTWVNLHEVWMDSYERGDWPGWDEDDMQAAGWGWGFFKRVGRGFGYDSEVQGRPEYWNWMVPGAAEAELGLPAYNPDRDHGLVSFPDLRRGTWGDEGDYGDIIGYLSRDRQYQGTFDSEDDSEIKFIMGNYTIGRGTGARMDNWVNRVAVATGFADWNSGLDVEDAWWKVAGLDRGGNGDSVLDDDEMIWGPEGDRGRTARLRDTSSSDYMKDLWREYALYVSMGRSSMTDGHAGFQWKFGVKTFANFMLDQRNSHADSPEFAKSPAQPMLAVKNAVKLLSDPSVLAPEYHDQLGLVSYGTSCRHEPYPDADDDPSMWLSFDLSVATSRLDELQAGYYDGYTNLHGGIRVGREALMTSPPARPGAAKVMVILSDGTPTAHEEGSGDGIVNVEAAGSEAIIAEARRRAADEAALARSEGIQIVTVSVGAMADQDFLREEISGESGRHFHAEGDIEDYSEDLKAIFLQIADIRPVTLVE